MAGIEKQIELFNKASYKVCVISFGDVKGATSWLTSTGCQLDMYLDPERDLYNLLGLQRSVSKVWSTTTLHYYGSMVAMGRKLPSAIEGVEDDPLQMGGDFTIRTTDKVLILSHPSKNPKDRPEISKILTFDS